MRQAPQQPSDLEVCQKPWKYIGWPGYARFAASDDDFLVLRRFDVSSTRVLLYMQDHIASLEESLEKIDRESSLPSAPDTNNGTFRQEPISDRARIIQQLKPALHEYKHFLWLHAELKSRPPACAESRMNVAAWTWNHPGAIMGNEAAFMGATDLINIVTRQRSPIRRVLELLKVFKFRSLFDAKEANDAYESHATTYSDSRIEGLVTILQLVFGLTMLIAPLWILSHVSNMNVRLAFISGSIVVFLLLVTLLTAAKASEALAATAAYSAVVMVFMQNSPS